MASQAAHALQQAIVNEKKGSLLSLAIRGLGVVAEKTNQRAIKEDIAAFLARLLEDRTGRRCHRSVDEACNGDATRRSEYGKEGQYGKEEDSESAAMADGKEGNDDQDEASAKDVDMQIVSTLLFVGRKNPIVIGVEMLAIASAGLLLSSSAGLRMRALELLAVGMEGETERKRERERGSSMKTVKRSLPKNLLLFTEDPYPAVRQAALDMLHVAFRNDWISDRDGYQAASSRLQDDNEDVRLAAIKLVSDCAVPHWIRSGSLGHDQQKIVDDAFVQICGAMSDMVMKVRLEATSLLGRFVCASENVLMQALRKKKIEESNCDEKGDGGNSQSKEDTTSVEDGGDMEILKSEEEGNLLLESNAAGALIHALEDEFKEVRLAAIHSISELGRYCPAFAAKGCSFLLDLLNDEFHTVRVCSADALMQLVGGTELQGEEIQVVLSLLAEKSKESRLAGQRLMFTIRFGGLSSIRVTIHALLAGIERHPEDEKDIILALWKIGQNNPSLIECLLDELLEEAKGALSGEGSIDDAAYMALLVLLLSAATSGNRSTMSLLPPYMIQHVQILYPRIRYLPLQLDVELVGYGVTSYVDILDKQTGKHGSRPTKLRAPVGYGVAGSRGDVADIDEMVQKEAAFDGKDFRQRVSGNSCEENSGPGRLRSPAVMEMDGGREKSYSSPEEFSAEHGRAKEEEIVGNSSNAHVIWQMQAKGAEELSRSMQAIMDGVLNVKQSVQSGCFHKALRTLSYCRAELSAIAQMAGETSTMARFCSLYIRCIALLVETRRSILYPHHKRHGQLMNGHVLQHSSLPRQLVELTWQVEGRFHGMSDTLRSDLYEIRLAGFMLELFRLQRCQRSQACQESEDMVEDAGGMIWMSESDLRKMVGVVCWISGKAAKQSKHTLLGSVSSKFRDIQQAAGSGPWSSQSSWKTYLDGIVTQVAHSYWPQKMSSHGSNLREVWADLRAPSSSSDLPIEFIRGLPLGVKVEAILHNVHPSHKLWLKLQIPGQLPELRKISAAHLSSFPGDSSKKVLNITAQLRNTTNIVACSLYVEVIMEYAPMEFRDEEIRCMDMDTAAAHVPMISDDCKMATKAADSVSQMGMWENDLARDQADYDDQRSRCNIHRIESHKNRKIKLSLCKRREVRLAIMKDRGHRVIPASV